MRYRGTHRAACAAMLRCRDYLEDAEAVAADVVGQTERVFDVERVDVIMVARLTRQVRASALRG